MPRRKRRLTVSPFVLHRQFNHASNPNVVITFDRDGNFMATAVHNIEAGSQLTISLGDPSNPTPLFAKYGFLYNDTPTIFCKAMHLQGEIEELGYDFTTPNSAARVGTTSTRLATCSIRCGASPGT